MRALTIATLTLLLATAGLPVRAADLSGEVLETRDVEGYTYLHLKTAQGEAWAAVTTAAVKKGSQVTIDHATTMQNVESKTLKKTFDKIVFGQIAGTDAQRADPHGARPAAGTAGPAPKVVKVAKATGPEAKTVAEVVSGRAALNNKTVLVRGQVVKVNLGIMGKNWVHLQDGSGSSADGTNDILVTTTDKAAVGDIVNARGTVHTDVKLGAGYAYAVLVEAAAIHK